MFAKRGIFRPISWLARKAGMTKVTMGTKAVPTVFWTRGHTITSQVMRLGYFGLLFRVLR